MSATPLRAPGEGAARGTSIVALVLAAMEVPMSIEILRVRGPNRRHSLAFPLLLAALLAACDASTDPVAVEEPVEPSKTILAAASPIPVPAELHGCGAAVPYDTGDPANPTALYQICWPAEWNGSFLAYAHGYVSNLDPLAIPGEAAELAAFATSQHFAFAATSYRANGLAIREGTEDIAVLAGLVRAQAGELFPGSGPVPIVLAGASEGGAVATLAAERYPGLFQGALSVCGPTGDFQRQIDYLAHFIVLFNYYFPTVFADGAGDFLVTPAGVALDPVTDWGDPADGVFGPRAQLAAAAIDANPAKALELLEVAGVAHDPADPRSATSAIFGILWYNVYGTEDAIEKVGGPAFDNRWHWYRGTSNDGKLNWSVQRFVGDPGARATIAEHYQTSGRLEMPYVSLHTTGDEIVEFWQQPRYRIAAMLNGAAHEHSAFPVFRNGHCNFEAGELVAGFGLLLLKLGAVSPTLVAEKMPGAAASMFWELAGG